MILVNTRSGVHINRCSRFQVSTLYPLTRIKSPGSQSHTSLANIHFTIGQLAKPHDRHTHTLQGRVFTRLQFKGTKTMIHY